MNFIFIINLVEGSFVRQSISYIQVHGILHVRWVDLPHGEHDDADRGHVRSGPSGVPVRRSAHRLAQLSARLRTWHPSVHSQRRFQHFVASSAKNCQVILLFHCRVGTRTNMWTVLRFYWVRLLFRATVFVTLLSIAYFVIRRYWDTFSFRITSDYWLIAMWRYQVFNNLKH